MRQERSGANSISYRARSAFDRRNPLNWLIVVGVLLIATIVIGTAITVLNFRERALTNRERELENTVLLLARHFDRQLHDSSHRNDVVRRMSSGLASPDNSGARCLASGFRQSEGLADGLSVVGGIHVLTPMGAVNSSQSGRLLRQHRGPPLFQGIRGVDRSPRLRLAPVNSRLGMDVVIARKVVGPNGRLGVVSRRCAPASGFFSSVALGPGRPFRWSIATERSHGIPTLKRCRAKFPNRSVQKCWLS